jgi:hypothetical protein
MRAMASGNSANQPACHRDRTGWRKGTFEISLFDPVSTSRIGYWQMGSFRKMLFPWLADIGNFDARVI